MIDAHAHLSAPSIAGAVDDVVSQLRAGGLTGVVIGGVDSADWRRQQALSAIYPDFVVRSAGIHPWVVRDRADQELTAMLDDLRSVVDVATLIGEVGLDFYRDNSIEQKDKQVYWCEEQLKIAQTAGKPVVLHVVKGHDQMLRLLDKYPKVKGLVHGFSGGADLGRDYAQRGFLISLGARFLRRQSIDDLKWLKQMPFVLESDAPNYHGVDVKPADAVSEWLEDLRFASAYLANIFSLSQPQIWSRSDQNIHRLIGWTK